MTTYCYVRCSTQEQDEDGRTTLADQERRAQGVMLIAGLDPATAVTVADVGVSGSVPLAKRPKGGPMLAGLKAGDTVIAAKLDRLFRSAADALVTADALKQRGVRLVLADMGPDPVTENGTSKLFFGMLASFAEFERTRIAERMEDGRRGKKARGGHIGGKAPYGSRVEGSGREATLVPVPEERATIAVACRLRAEGLSLRAIGERLEDEGLYPRTGRHWQVETVRRLLAHEGGAP